MPKKAATLDEKKERFDDATRALADIKKLIKDSEDGGNDSSVYDSMLSTIQSQYDIAQTAFENGMASDFRDSDDSYLTEVFRPTVMPMISQILENLEAATDEAMGEGFYDARVVGRDVIIRFSIGDDKNSREIQLVNPRQQQARTFRVTSFSGNIPPGVTAALETIEGADKLSDIVWKSKKTFIETMCVRSVEKIKDKDAVVFTFAGKKVRTVNEMIKLLEADYELTLEHGEEEELLSLTNTKAPFG